jgi:ubiquinone/menaquinone biosynthesis C-methylase UbiE
MSTHNDEKKEQVKAYFSRTAASYVTSTSHRAGRDLQHLIEWGEFAKGQKALDIATGGGHTALAIAPLVEEITVTDLTPMMLEEARIFLVAQGVENAQFLVADAEQLPFADGSFERVTCRIAPHHFTDVAQAVKEVARVLKPGGIFLVIDSCAAEESELDIFANKIEKWRDPSHGRSYKISEWQNFFRQAGLQIEGQESFRKAHQYDDWTLRSQMAQEEKLALEEFVLKSDVQIKEYFGIKQKADGHLDTFSLDYFLMKGKIKA